MKRGIIYGLIAAAGLFVLWGTLHRRGKRVDRGIAAPVLGADDKAKIIFDQNNHTVTRVDSTGAHRTFLNSHGPVSIVEKKDGRTVLIQRTWGTELSPNIGAAIGAALKFRVAVGVNGLYIQRWEIGGGLLLHPSEPKDLRPYVAVSYNVYSSWLISAGVDNHKVVYLIASVRI